MQIYVMKSILEVAKRMAETANKSEKISHFKTLCYICERTL